MQSAVHVMILELADGQSSHVVFSPGAALRDKIQSCRPRFAGVYQFISLGQNGVLDLIMVALPVPVALLVAAG